MKPEISIIVPSYNYDNYIGFCLNSCINQSFSNFEVVVVDDKSTDSSISVIKSFMDKDPRIRLVDLPVNKGYSHAKNEGIISAKGKYIAHLDADDMLTKGSLSVRINAFKEDTSLFFVHGQGLDFFGPKSYKWCLENERRLKVTKVQIHAQGVMLKRECYEKYGLYDEKLRSKSDKEMWVRLRDTVGIKVKKINIPVAFYRQHTDSMHFFRQKNKKYNDSVLKIFTEQSTSRKKEGINKNNTRFIDG